MIEQEQINLPLEVNAIAVIADNINADFEPASDDTPQSVSDDTPQSVSDDTSQFASDDAPKSASDDATMPEAVIQPEPEKQVLGIRLRRAGQLFFFLDTVHSVRIGTKVIVGFEYGQALGEVVSIFTQPSDKLLQQDMLSGKVLGSATAQDIAHHTENILLIDEAAAFCKTCIHQHELDMKLVDVEVFFDRSKIIFYFTAPSRIDFRELVKDLVRNYRTRIELRQIGVRHETQMVGGLGNCGNVCCCHQFLRKFAPVTIKMAKEQNLFLNPAKLSGMCGRLLCCLSYEQENYEEFNKRCPKLGKRYNTSIGMVKILRSNMFANSLTCLVADNEEREMTLEEWDTLRPKRTEQGKNDDNASLYSGKSALQNAYEDADLLAMAALEDDEAASAARVMPRNKPNKNDSTRYDKSKEYHKNK